MTLSQEDFSALRLLIREEVHDIIRPFRAEVNQKFDEFAQHFDELYKRSGEHEVELTVLNKRLTNTGKTMDKIQRDLKKELSGVKRRVFTLEDKVA